MHARIERYLPCNFGHACGCAAVCSRGVIEDTKAMNNYISAAKYALAGLGRIIIHGKILLFFNPNMYVQSLFLLIYSSK